MTHFGQNNLIQLLGGPLVSDGYITWGDYLVHLVVWCVLCCLLTTMCFEYTKCILILCIVLYMTL